MRKSRGFKRFTAMLAALSLSAAMLTGFIAFTEPVYAMAEEQPQGSFENTADPATTKITTDGSNRFFMNGIAVVLKKAEDGKQYLYDEAGNKLSVYYDALCEKGVAGEEMVDYVIPVNASIFGGANGVSIEGDTKVTIESGVTITQVYAGGRKKGVAANVSGTSNLFISGPDTVINGAISGGSFQSKSGNTFVQISDYTAAAKNKYVAAGSIGNGGGVTGNSAIVITNSTVTSVYGGVYNANGGVGEASYVSLTNCTVTEGVYGGNYGSCAVKGAVTIKLNGGTYPEVYGAGSITTSSVLGDINISVAGGTTVGKLYPLGIIGTTGTATKKAYVTVPDAELADYIDFDDLAKAESIIQADGTVYNRIFVNGTVMGLVVRDDIAYATEYAQAVPTYNASLNYVYLNGVSAVIKEDPADGNTYVYDSTGTTKLLDNVIDDARVFGGGVQNKVASTRIVMESGCVDYIYGGSLGGIVEGNCEVIINNGTITSCLYAGGINNESGGMTWVSMIDSISCTVNGGNIKDFFAAKSGINKNINIVYNGGMTRNFYCGNSDDLYDYDINRVIGDINVEINGGAHGTLYGGCAAAVVEGNITITITGHEMFTSCVINPLGNTNKGASVDGTVTLNLYSGFDTSIINDIDNVTVNLSAVPNTVVKEVKTYVQNKAAVIDRTADAGNLVIRLLEMQQEGQTHDMPARSKAGDSTLLSLPNGQLMMIDTGYNTWAYDQIKADLAAMGVEKIDYLMLTHYHSDHAYNFGSVLTDYSVDHVILPSYEVGANSDAVGYYEKVTTAVNDAITAGTLLEENVTRLNSASEIITIGEGEQAITLKVYNPDETVTIVDNDANVTTTVKETTTNNASLVFKISYRDSSILFSGDIYAAQEKKLAALYGSELASDVMLMPHHAQFTSNTPAYIKAVNPSVAVAMMLQPDGATTRVTLDRYARYSNAETYITGTNGMIKLVLDGTDSIRVETEYTDESKIVPPTPEPEKPENPIKSFFDKIFQKIKKGMEVIIRNCEYEITSDSGAEQGTVKYLNAIIAKSTIEIPATVELDGFTYEVTSIADKAFKNAILLRNVNIGENVEAIGAEAFYRCISLKKIVILSDDLTYIGKNAFAKINKNAVIYVPEEKLEEYTQLLKDAGLPKTVKIKIS